MKNTFVSQLQPGPLNETAVFLVSAKEVRQKKTGEPYLSLTLCDRTGEIDAKMWDNVADVMDTFDRDDFVKLRGVLQVYNNRLQLTIHRLARQPDEAVDFTDFFPAAQRPFDEMYEELRGVVAEMKNDHLRELVSGIIEDPAIRPKFRIAPAAKSVHHAYLGGLLEHVLSMCALARVTAAHYKTIDLDLLMAGVVLHDIGKIEELTYERSFNYSNDGQLLGHIQIGMRIVGDRIAHMPGFPPKLRTLLEHLILSHHGHLEFGSPRVPLFPEALLLHHLDNLDSKMECMRNSVERDRLVEGCFTGYIPSLERAVLKKARYLDCEEKSPQSKQAAAGAVAAERPQASERPQAAPQRSAPSGSPFAQKLIGALRKEGGT